MVSRTPRIAGEVKRVFVLVHGVIAGQTGYFMGPYYNFKGYVLQGDKLWPCAIFHGFETLQEARSYWDTVFNVQWTLLPPRP